MKAIAAMLLLSACSGCVHTLPTTYTPVILLYPTMPENRAVTSCSLNNEPVVLMDSLTWHSLEYREMTIRHEEDHAVRAKNHPGGCWPYMRRMSRDKTFRVREQLHAFCVAGRFAMTRNRTAESLWLEIVAAMAPDTVLTAKDNCIYTEGNRL